MSGLPPLLAALSLRSRETPPAALQTAADPTNVLDFKIIFSIVNESPITADKKKEDIRAIGMKAGELRRKVGSPARAPRRRSRRSFSTIEVCQFFDISKATLYRWEREGLISMPSRDWRNWRLYSEANIEEIKHLIRRRNTD